MATSTKPVSLLRRGFKADAEKAASRYRNELNLKEHEPLSAYELAKHLSVRIILPNEIPGITRDILDPLLVGAGKSRWSAAIYQKNEKKYIIHNPTHSIARQESNLMHELAHAACEHELDTLEVALTGCIVPLRKYNDVQEAEAEWMGAVLHLPQKALFHYHHVLKKSPDDICAVFKASKEMFNFRMRKSGVTKISFKK